MILSRRGFFRQVTSVAAVHFLPLIDGWIKLDTSVLYVKDLTLVGWQFNAIAAWAHKQPNWQFDTIVYCDSFECAIDAIEDWPKYYDAEYGKGAWTKKQNLVGLAGEEREKV